MEQVNLSKVSKYVEHIEQTTTFKKKHSDENMLISQNPGPQSAKPVNAMRTISRRMRKVSSLDSDHSPIAFSKTPVMSFG